MQFPRHQVAEVVEDSEPEREEARKRRRQERRMRRDQMDALEVIELTDSDSSDSVLYGSREWHAKKVAIQTRKAVDQNSTFFTPSQWHYSSGTNLDNVAAVRTSVSSVGSATFSVGMRTPVAEVDAVEVRSTDVEYVPTDEEVDESAGSLRSKLGSFVFSSTSQTPSKIGDPTQPSRTTTHIIEAFEETKTRKKRSVKGHALYLDFLEHQLDGLLVCVSCDLKWTVRKTAEHKIAHLRTCARKMRFTDETMKTLISRELKMKHANMEDVERQAQIQSKPAKTYLEDAATGSKSQKTGRRRKEPASTVRAITESRDSIRDRARYYLNRTSSDGKIAEESGGIPLAARSSGSAGLVADVAEDFLATYEDDEPPRTQPLPKSNIAIASSSRSLELMGKPPIFNSLTSSNLSIPDELPPPGWTGSTLLNEDRLMDVVSPSSHRLLIPAASHEYARTHGAHQVSINQSVYESDADDDAILIFEPGALPLPIQNSPQNHSPPAHDILHSDGITNAPSRESEKGFTLTVYADGHTVATNLNTNKKEDPPRDIHKLQDTEEASVKKMTKAKSRRKRNVQDNTISGDTDNLAISDEDLFTKFKAIVLEDKALYRRILRYEPIRFDALVELVYERATEHAPSPGIIKNKLRTFLDNQAIHYYGSEIGGWNRR